MSSSNDLISSLRSRRVAVVGDIMLDHYIWGDTYRISPEAPVPVIEVQRESHTAGGAANVALNLAALGVHTTLAGSYGNDSAGFRLAGILAEKGVNLSAEYASDDRQTISKTRVVVQRQQMCRIDVEDAPSRYGVAAGRGLEAVARLAEESDAVILSDYAKGMLTQGLMDSVCAAARRGGRVIAWDPKPKNQLLIQGVTVITPNRAEAYQLAGLPERRHNEPFPADAIGQAIFERYRPKYLVVTLGAEGMMLYEGLYHRRHLPTVAREVFDVSGAGDTVVAVLAAALAAGRSLTEAAVAANAAAGVVVAKLGTATIGPGELKAAIDACQGSPSTAVSIPA